MLTARLTSSGQQREIGPNALGRMRILPFMRSEPDGTSLTSVIVQRSEVRNQRSDEPPVRTPFARKWEPVAASRVGCNAARDTRATTEARAQRPFDQPALDKRAGRAEYRNDDGDSSLRYFVAGGGGARACSAIFQQNPSVSVTTRRIQLRTGVGLESRMLKAFE